MATKSPFTAVDSLDPIYYTFTHLHISHISYTTHFDRNVGNFALDVVFEVALSCWLVGIDQ